MSLDTGPENNKSNDRKVDGVLFEYAQRLTAIERGEDAGAPLGSVGHSQSLGRERFHRRVFAMKSHKFGDQNDGR